MPNRGCSEPEPSRSWRHDPGHRPFGDSGWIDRVRNSLDVSEASPPIADESPPIFPSCPNLIFGNAVP